MTLFGNRKIVSRKKGDSVLIFFGTRQRTHSDYKFHYAIDDAVFNTMSMG